MHLVGLGKGVGVRRIQCGDSGCPFENFNSGGIARIDFHRTNLSIAIDQGINLGRQGARFGPRGIREGSYKYRSVQEVAENHTTVDLDTNIGVRFKGDHAMGDIGDLSPMMAMSRRFSLSPLSSRVT